jgi:D-glycero-alpha-D-manno-heptose-7-phosphate kinase
MGLRVTAPVRIDISAGWPDSDPYRRDYGGAVLNAAINQRVSAHFDGNLTISPDKVQSHSGQGTSGALRSVELVASNPGLLKDRIGLIKKVHFLENRIVGHRAGFQDEAAAIYGGVNYWEFSSRGAIRRTPILKRKAGHLQERVVLIYTGESHLSGNIHELVFGGRNYERNTPRFDRMKAIASEMRDSIDDEDKMALLIAETWELQKGLHPSIETPQMRALQRYLAGTYLAARAIGAGGGGSMLFYTSDRKSLVKMFSARKTLKKMEIIPFRFEYRGIKVSKR